MTTTADHFTAFVDRFSAAVDAMRGTAQEMAVDLRRAIGSSPSPADSPHRISGLQCFAPEI